MLRILWLLFGTERFEEATSSVNSILDFRVLTPWYGWMPWANSSYLVAPTPEVVFQYEFFKLNVHLLQTTTYCPLLPFCPLRHFWQPNFILSCHIICEGPTLHTNEAVNITFIFCPWKCYHSNDSTYVILNELSSHFGFKAKWFIRLRPCLYNSNIRIQICFILDICS